MMTTGGAPRELGGGARYERKFIAGGMTSAAVIAMVCRHPALFREVYPPRHVNSLYLDTPTRGDYADHVNGARVRGKTRVRWYGDAIAAADGAALERKLRTGNIGIKLTYGLGRLRVGPGLTQADLAPVLDSAELPEVLRLDLRFRQPVLMVRYRRHYFAAAACGIRLTVDSEIEYAGRGACCRESAVVVEVKYSPDEAEHAEAAANALPFVLARFSKYVRGIDRTRTAA